jgi:hypothetical protein
MRSSFGSGAGVRGGEGSGELGRKRVEGSRCDDVMILVGRWKRGVMGRFFGVRTRFLLRAIVDLGG